jgi:hypothetical protein
MSAVVLAHLAEVDVRGAHRQWACDTLVAYCVYELRLSEDEAQRRCRAARVARQFPLLFSMLADGSIHLTGIVLLAPHLTPENHREVLARAHAIGENERPSFSAGAAREGVGRRHLGPDHHDERTGVAVGALRDEWCPTVRSSELHGHEPTIGIERE